MFVNKTLLRLCWIFNRYVSLIFHVSPEMSRTYPSSIHILQHVAKWILFVLMLSRFEPMQSSSLELPKHRVFDSCKRAARRMVDDAGSPADSGAPILKNLDEIKYASLAAAWHPKCLRYTRIHVINTPMFADVHM